MGKSHGVNDEVGQNYIVVSTLLCSKLHPTTCEFCTNIYKHSILLYNCKHERRCTGDFIEKIITPLTVDLLKYQRKGNCTLIVLEMQSFYISNISRW